MGERKFTKGLGRPGMAAQLRETVSQVVRDSSNNVSLSFVQFFPTLKFQIYNNR